VTGSGKAVARTGRVLFSLAAFGCLSCVSQSEHPSRSPSTLKIGLGQTTGQSSGASVQQVAANLTGDPLIGFGGDGRPQPWVLERWETSADGLETTVWLKPGLKFRNGQPLSAEIVADILTRQFAASLGPAAEDVDRVVPSGSAVKIRLHRRSTFIVDALSVVLRGPVPEATTGAYYEAGSSEGDVELLANQNYFLGKPAIDRLVIRPYSSLRAAWADMLRGQVDMLYEVGPDTVDLLQGASSVRLIVQQRRNAYVMVLNVQRPPLRDKGIRRLLNAAIDRPELIDHALAGHALPADSPVWPSHWAFSQDAPRFGYRPAMAPRRIELSCVLPDGSLERLALSAQQMLAAVGVDLKLELVSIDEWLRRAQAGEFDVLLTDALLGPNLLRPYQFWHTGSPNNYGHYSSPAVDAALDRVRHAANDDEYRAGVAAFQHAIVDDPPAIFLAWSQRARAVSRRFEVPVEPGRDVLGTLRLWRPAADKQPSPD
jgi:peptide/nickel transport system substrate-binding protein